MSDVGIIGFLIVRDPEIPPGVVEVQRNVLTGLWRLVTGGEFVSLTTIPKAVRCAVRRKESGQ